MAAILIGRDLILALLLPIYRRRGLPPPDVMYLGKAATFALMFALPLLLAAQGDWGIRHDRASLGLRAADLGHRPVRLDRPLYLADRGEHRPRGAGAVAAERPVTR